MSQKTTNVAYSSDPQRTVRSLEIPPFVMYMLSTTATATTATAASTVSSSIPDSGNPSTDHSAQRNHDNEERIRSLTANHMRNVFAKSMNPDLFHEIVDFDLEFLDSAQINPIKQETEEGTDVISEEKNIDDDLHKRRLLMNDGNSSEPYQNTILYFYGKVDLLVPSPPGPNAHQQQIDLDSMIRDLTVQSFLGYNLNVYINDYLNSNYNEGVGSVSYVVKNVLVTPLTEDLLVELPVFQNNSVIPAASTIAHSTTLSTEEKRKNQFMMMGAIAITVSFVTVCSFLSLCSAVRDRGRHPSLKNLDIGDNNNNRRAGLISRHKWRRFCLGGKGEKSPPPQMISYRSRRKRAKTNDINESPSSLHGTHHNILFQDEDIFSQITQPTGTIGSGTDTVSSNCATEDDTDVESQICYGSHHFDYCSNNFSSCTSISRNFRALKDLEGGAAKVNTLNDSSKNISPNSSSVSTISYEGDEESVVLWESSVTGSSWQTCAEKLMLFSSPDDTEDGSKSEEEDQPNPLNQEDEENQFASLQVSKADEIDEDDLDFESDLDSTTTGKSSNPRHLSSAKSRNSFLTKAISKARNLIPQTSPIKKMRNKHSINKLEKIFKMESEMSKEEVVSMVKYLNRSNVKGKNDVSSSTSLSSNRSNTKTNTTVDTPLPSCNSSLASSSSERSATQKVQNQKQDLLALSHCSSHNESFSSSRKRKKISRRSDFYFSPVHSTTSSSSPTEKTLEMLDLELQPAETSSIALVPTSNKAYPHASYNRPTQTGLLEDGLSISNSTSDTEKIVQVLGNKKNHSQRLISTESLEPPSVSSLSFSTSVSSTSTLSDVASSLAKLRKHCIDPESDKENSMLYQSMTDDDDSETKRHANTTKKTKNRKEQPFQLLQMSIDTEDDHLNIHRSLLSPKPLKLSSKQPRFSFGLIDSSSSQDTSTLSLLHSPVKESAPEANAMSNITNLNS